MSSFRPSGSWKRSKWRRIHVWRCVLLWWMVHVSSAQSSDLTFYIPEGKPIGTVVGNISLAQSHITDSSPKNGRSDFDLGQNGILTTKVILDRENLVLNNGKYNLTVISFSIIPPKICNVLVLVQDVNDNSPRFVGGGYSSLVLSEGHPSFPYKIIASDPDYGSNSTQSYDIISGDIDGVFKLDIKRDQNGDLYSDLVLNVGKDLDREAIDSYVLNISASDGGNPIRKDFLLLNITVSDLNDNPPVFSSLNYTIAIPEDTKPSTYILQLNATDKDIGTNAVIYYSIEQHSDPKKEFGIGVNTGQIEPYIKLDYETKRQYRLSVKAENRGSSNQQFTTTLVIIDLLDVNDNTPEIKIEYSQGGRYQVFEDAKVGTPVASVYVTDKDSGRNGEVNVTLEGGDGFFSMKYDVPTLRSIICVGKPLDREKQHVFILTASCIDNGLPPLSKKISSRINVGDVNDNFPKCSRHIYVSRVYENATVNTLVAKVHATDSDEGVNAELIYAIANTTQSAAYRGLFAIDSATGEIRTVSGLDREKTAQPVLTVVVSDKGNPTLTTNCTVIVNISDNNDNDPIFNQSVYQAEVSENCPLDTFVLDVFAEDPDLGEHSLIQYTIANHNAVPFSIDLQTGRVSTSGYIDHDTKPSYTFQVAATDGGGRRVSASVNIAVLDLNDNVPVFIPDKYDKQLLENIPIDYVIATVVAKDKDSGIYSQLTYSFATGNGDGLFSINSSSGVITLTKHLDRETKDFYSLTICAVDGGGNQSSNMATLTITVLDVNDEPPLFDQPSYNFSVVENSQPTIIGTVKATSKDLGTNALVSYTIQNGISSHLFTINQTGTIYLRSAVDHETTPRIILRIQAKDGGTPALYGYVDVDINVTDLNDNNPYFNASVLQVYVPENTATGSVFYTVKAKDPDSGSFGLLTYTLLTNPGQIFHVQQGTGALSLQKAVNFETEGKSFSLKVRAQDGGSPSLSAQATLNVSVVDVNDHAPVFLNASYVVHVPESRTAPSDIIRVSATDKDSGENARIRYSFKAGVDTTKFGLQSDGWISIKTQLDREDIEVYRITVIASDHGLPRPLTASADVTVIVDDLNDNNPKFKQKSYIFYVQEGKANGTVVDQVSASDSDKGSNSELTYSFESALNEFVISKTTGVIKTNKVLDREKKASYSITVVANDHGSSSRHDKTLVTIIVRDVNDNSPVFKPSQYEKKVYEDVSVGSPLLKVTAVDADEVGPNSAIQYSIVAGQQNSHVFSINSKTGEISVFASLDREKKDRYILHVAAKDTGSPPKDNIAMVSIYVLDINDNQPRFLNRTDFVNVPEKLPVGSIVTQVKAVDNDDGDNGRIQYEIVQGNIGGTFQINVTSGVIRTRLVLDFERQNRYQLKISAKDMGQRQHTTYRWVNVFVLDANDNRPTFEKNPIIASVYEGVAVNHTVKTVQARDDDSGSNSWIWYSIDSQYPEAHFKINPTTGTIQTIAQIDREAIAEYTLIVRATDQAYTQKDRLYSTATLKVVVLDLNDNKPVFVSRNMTYVMEDEPFNFEVMSITALDYDTGRRGKVEYRIVTGDTGKFSLDPKSGVLKKIGKLDYELKHSHMLNVSATDEGSPPLSSYQLLTIIVVDVNDNSPEFTTSLFIGNVSEGEPRGSHVMHVTARDRDSGTNAELTYSIPSGVENHKKFCINATTGLVTTNATLDREEKAFYTFLVYATGRTFPFRVSTTTVRINVLDKNDQRPTFATSSVTRRVLENAALGVFYTVVANDLDYGINAKVKYRILSGNSDASFSISAETGELSTVKMLDREVTAKYTLSVEARDVVTPFYVATCQVIVMVEDRNDNRPKFLKPMYSVVVSELSPVGTSLVNVTATDKDMGANGQIVYSLPNDTYQALRIDPHTGIIYNTAQFDTSVQSLYDFYCFAQDQGADRKTKLVQVKIEIEDKNTHFPVFSKTPYQVNVFQNASSGLSILSVSASDADTNKKTNGKVTYRFNDSFKSALFVLESNTGTLKTSLGFNNPPAGRQILYIRAEDHGQPPKGAEGIVEVLIGPVQDHPPTFVNQSKSNAWVRENTSTNGYVTRVIAQAKNNDPVTYSIISGNLGNAFFIYPDTGVVTVNTALDYEASAEYKLQLVATLKHGLSLNGYMELDVHVTDVNDNDPVFHPTNIATQLAEDNGSFVPRAVVIVTATDADSTSNADVVYSLQSGNINDTFDIDPSSGLIKTHKPVDREKVALYSLVVKATDQGNPSRSSTSKVEVTISDVNDNAPIFNAPIFTTVSILEDTRPGSVITMATATDADQDSQLVYTLQSRSAAGMFSVSRFFGLVTLLKPPDYETTARYSLVIGVSDGLHRADLTLTVIVLDVNDNAPTFLNSSYQFTISHSIDAGVPVLRVSASDQDSGTNGLVHYSFLQPIPDFLINATSGVISSKKRIEVGFRDALNQILVVATDRGSPSQRALVYVRILITKEPQFDRARYTASVSEDARVGKTILTVQTTNDAPNIPLVRISYVIESGNLRGQFRIGQRSGVISINAPLDYETEKKYQLVVRAYDDIAPSKLVRVTVLINVTDVNDLKPVFRQSEYLAQWTEGVAIGTIVLNVSATDRDSGSNGEVSYSIQSGDDKDSFSIDANAGVIRTVKPLDHDSIKTHHLSVRATDKGTPPLHSEVSVTIQVLDLNDNPPIFHIPNPEQVKVPENSPISTVFYNLTATDKDSNSNGRLSYSIIGGEGKGLFIINPLTGWLKTNATFDYETKPSYSLQVKAADSGSPPLQTNITITVNIAGVDEYFPSFMSSEYKFKVPANAEVDAFVGQVSATDRDAGEDGVLFYSFINPGDALKINRTSGVISVNRTLNDGSKLQQQRNRRSIGSYDMLLIGNLVKTRVRRAAEEEQIYLRVMADSGKPHSKTSKAFVSVSVDFTCPGCGVVKKPQIAGGISGTGLVIIVALAVLAGVILLVLIVVMLLFYSQRKRKRARRNPRLKFDGSFDEITVHPPGNSNHAAVSAESLPGRTYPPEYTPLTRTTDNSNNATSTDASETPGSASSGRGSSDGDSEDGPTRNGEVGSVHSDNYTTKTVIADSGIQPDDDDQISQLTISDGSGILHADGSELKPYKMDKIRSRLDYDKSQESIHVFGEEGGGEADGGRDVGNLLYAKLAEVDADDESIAETPRPFVDEGRERAPYAGSLSSIVGSKEELAGSYNWDYLLDWGPQFQPLAEVFLEIGRMKDDVDSNKAPGRSGSITPSRLPSQLPGIATADMLSSMSSLPRSPISPPSTRFTSPAFSPNFTPAITPLITRSPSVSPLGTGTVSPSFSPQVSRPASTYIHISRTHRDSQGDSNSELSHSPSISDNESNLEIDI